MRQSSTRIFWTSSSASLSWRRTGSFLVQAVIAGTRIVTNSGHAVRSPSCEIRSSKDFGVRCIEARHSYIFPTTMNVSPVPADTRYSEISHVRQESEVPASKYANRNTTSRRALAIKDRSVSWTAPCCPLSPSFFCGCCVVLHGSILAKNWGRGPGRGGRFITLPSAHPAYRPPSSPWGRSTSVSHGKFLSRKHFGESESSNMALSS